MNVIEIFSSIEGEGKRQGELCTFIRLAGCNMRCPYCDTKYSYDDKSIVQKMTVNEVAKKIQLLNIKNVTITGGEPLLQKDEILELVLKLKEFNFNIEINGTICSPFRTNNVFYTVDYKMPSSNACVPINKRWLKRLRKKDVLKFVVNDIYELNLMKNFILKHKYLHCLYYVSPIWGKIHLENIVDYLKKNNLQKVRIQLQMHKIIWSPDKRGV